MSFEFTWHELMSTDVPRAQMLLGELFGWQVRDHHLLHDGAPAASILPFAHAEPGSHWVPYAAASDLAAFRAQLVAAGGTVCFGATAHPDGGSFLFATDPQGGYFSVRDRAVAGSPVWWKDKLLADAPAVATAFYERLGMASPFVVPRPPVAPRTMWMPHVLVDDLAATTARARRLGMMIVVDAKTTDDGTYAVYADGATGVLAAVEVTRGA